MSFSTFILDTTFESTVSGSVQDFLNTKTGKEIIISFNWIVAEDITLPTGTFFTFVDGGKLTMETGYTATDVRINNHYTSQIFDGGGNIVFASDCKIEHKVTWYGTITRALRCLGSVTSAILIIDTTIDTTGLTITVPANVHIKYENSGNWSGSGTLTISSMDFTPDWQLFNSDITLNISNCKIPYVMPNWYSTLLPPKFIITREGGYAIKLTNRTGGNSVKGEVVTTSSSYDNAVSKIIVDVPNPIGVFYETGIANGAEAWVVVSGIADVSFIGNTTRGHLARGFVTGDAGYISGKALSEAVPTSPFATDKHFYEIGHVLESRTGAGLAKCVLHFN